MPRPLAIAALAALIALVPSTAAATPVDGTEHSPNMRHVGNFPYAAANGTTPNYGTDIEFTEIRGRRYAFAGSYRNGMQIFDITDPARTTQVGRYDCGVTQGDVQLFRQDDEPGRVFATYTSDTYGDGKSTCYREAAALGFETLKANGSGRNGTFVLEVTDPTAPRTVAFAEAPKGSHNLTVHPSGDWMYNSNSDLITSVLGEVDGRGPAIEVFDIRDPRKPRLAATLKLPIRPGLGTESHDITFNERGDRAYSAALSQGVIINTTEPGAPKIITSFLDPTINVWHQSDPVTVRGDDGRARELLFVEDEFVGAVGTGQCPNGGVHVFDITGANELDPKKVGFWNIDDVRATDRATHSCTAHVFDLHEREQLMTIAYYNGGVRVVDFSGLGKVGVGIGDKAVEGMREVGFFRMEGANAWSAKTPKIHPVTGDFHLFANDISRGLDVFHFDGNGQRSARGGRWETPEEHAARTTPLAPADWPGPLDLLLEAQDEHERPGGHSHDAHSH